MEKLILGNDETYTSLEHNLFSERLKRAKKQSAACLQAAERIKAQWKEKKTFALTLRLSSITDNEFAALREEITLCPSKSLPSVLERVNKLIEYCLLGKPPCST